MFFGSFVKRPLLPAFLLLLPSLTAVPGHATPGQAKPGHAKPAQAKPVPAEAPATLLPKDFAGWTQSAPAETSDAPEKADAADAAILKEYGFQQFASAHYVNGDNQLTLRAIRFQDASGAFGAFTFFRRPGSLVEEIGRSAAWDGSHVLFWDGATLVEGTFDHMTAMTPAELRELAKDLPHPAGSANVPPALPGYLPRRGLALGQSHYALGPESYARSGGVLPPALVDFAAGSAESITANYSFRDGNGSLTLLIYPTPQLATARLRAIDDFLKAGNAQSAWPQALAKAGLALCSPAAVGRSLSSPAETFPRKKRTGCSTRLTIRPTSRGTTLTVMSVRGPR